MWLNWYPAVDLISNSFAQTPVSHLALLWATRSKYSQTQLGSVVLCENLKKSVKWAQRFWGGGRNPHFPHRNLFDMAGETSISASYLSTPGSCHPPGSYPVRPELLYVFPRQCPHKVFISLVPRLFRRLPEPHTFPQTHPQPQSEPHPPPPQWPMGQHIIPQVSRFLCFPSYMGPLHISIIHHTAAIYFNLPPPFAPAPRGVLRAVSCPGACGMGWGGEDV